MSGYFADPDVTPEESAAAVDALAAKYGVTEDVAALREAGQNGAMDLVSFLRARLAEDEERARFVQRERGDQHEIEPWRLSWHDEYDLLCIEPSRALAEVEAKRRIVAMHTPVTLQRMVDGQMQDVAACDYDTDPDGAGWTDYPCETLRILAATYKDHPDYRDEWRP